MTDERNPEVTPAAPEVSTAGDRPMPSLASRASMIRRWNQGSLLIVHGAQEKVSDEPLILEPKRQDEPDL